MPRYHGTWIDLDGVSPGLYYLLRVSPERGSERYVLSAEPGRTNGSHAERLQGWLGTTDNVARYAEGCVEVIRRNGRVRVRAIPAARMIESEEVSADARGTVQ